MSSYLSQFNYQFMRPKGVLAKAEDFQNPDLRRFVFLHGLMGSGINWRRIVSGLEPNDIALCYDQRGHGKSWKPLTGYSPTDYADDLEIIRQEIGWDRFILVGHSMGSRNAFIYASRFQDRVEKLVLEDKGPDSDSVSGQFYSDMLASIPTPFPNKQAAKDFFTNVFPKSRFAGHNPQVLAMYLYSNMTEDADGRADWRFFKEGILLSVTQGRGEDHWAEYESLEMPILVVRGEFSKDLTPQTYTDMLARNSHAKGVVIPNAGHWVHSDQPEAFLQAVLGFVNG